MLVRAPQGLIKKKYTLHLSQNSTELMTSNNISLNSTRICPELPKSSTAMFLGKFNLLKSGIFLLVTIRLSLASAAYMPDQTIVFERNDFVIHSDATFENYYEKVIRINTQTGVEDNGEISLAFNQDLEALDVTQAYVLQPDGEIAYVRPEDIRTRDAYIDEDAPIFSGEKNVFIIFPRLQVGSKVHFKVRTLQKTALFPGRFSWFDYYPSYSAVEFAQVNVSYEPSLNLQVSARGDFRPAPPPKSVLPTPPNYKRLSYTFEQPVASTYEDGAVSSLDTAPLIAISNFNGPEDLGRAYEERARPRSQPNKEIRDLAEKLIAGSDTDLEKLKHLHKWVAQNIRYVGTYLEAGGVVPNDAASILRRSYGDCKDHVTLLEALLTAVGVQSEPALINTVANYNPLPLTVVGAYNHVITYIPSLDLFVDSTSRYSPTGTLPSSDLGKKVLLTRSAKIVSTPPHSPDADKEVVTTFWKLYPNGNMTGQSSFSKTGWLEVSSRLYHVDNASTDQESDSRRYLRRSRESGTGKTNTPSSDDWSVPWVITTRTELNNVVNLPRPSAFEFPVGMAPGSIAAIATRTPLKSRDGPWLCHSRHHVEESSIELPEGVQVDLLPESVSIKSGNWTYESSYALTGRLLRAKRDLIMRFDSPSCEPLLATAWAGFVSQIRRDVRAQVFLRKMD